MRPPIPAKIRLVAVAVVAGCCWAVTPASATVIPPWFTTSITPDFFFSGDVATGDIDRVVPERHPQLGGLAPGREWFAWMTASGTGIVLTSWTDFNDGSDSFIGQIALDEGSSPLAPGTAPALAGVVQADGSVNICISGRSDGRCDLRTGLPSTGFRSYDFYLAFAPVAAVPEPGTTAILLIGLVVAGWARLRRRY